MNEPIPYEGRLLLRVRHAQVEHELIRQTRKIIIETAENNTRSVPTANGDARKLRGVPCLAEGVGGAIIGTRPGID